jgi:hypothetical protein
MGRLPETSVGILGDMREFGSLGVGGLAKLVQTFRYPPVWVCHFELACQVWVGEKGHPTVASWRCHVLSTVRLVAMVRRQVCSSREHMEKSCWMCGSRAAGSGERLICKR